MLTQGKLDEAKPFYDRAIAILEKALGPDHPHVAAALNNLAGLLKKQACVVEVCFVLLRV